MTTVNSLTHAAFLRKQGLLLAAFLLGVLFVAGFAIPQAHAQTASTTGTVSPYGKWPTCPDFVDKKATCTYPNGQKVQCTDTLSALDKFSGVVEEITCENPDKTTSVCAIQPGLQTNNQCQVTDANGKVVTTITSGEGLAGNGTTTIDSAGNVTSTPRTDLPGSTCSALNLAACILDIPGLIASGFAALILTVSSILLWISGVVFNWVIIRTVFQFATYFGTSEGMIIAWRIMRDIGNIALLFSFIFMGIATILNTHNVEGYTARRALPQLIIFAVLLNFSLFASQAIIDVSNGLSSTFATFAGESCKTAVSGEAGGEEFKECANKGISGAMVSAVGLNRVLDVQTNGVLKAPYTYAAMLILLSVLVLIMAVVLFAATIMLTIRAVVLSLLMVTSPIGFAGMVIPPLRGLSRDWWHKLINQSFFAPIYLLMLFVCLKLVQSLQGDGASVSDAIMGNTLAGETTAGNMQVIMVFVIVVGFMIAALTVAQKFGAYGATFATNAASGVVFGTMTRAANFTAGKLGTGIRNTALRRIQSGKGGAVSRLAFAAGSGLRGANLDARRLPGVAGALKAGGATSGANVAHHATYADMEHQVMDMREGKGLKEFNKKIDADLEKAMLDGFHGPELDDNLKKILAGTSVKNLAKVHGIKTGNAALVNGLSPEQFEGLMKSDDLSETEKGSIRTARFKDLVDAVNAKNEEQAKSIIKNLSKGELESAPSEVFAEGSVGLKALSDKQREDLSSSTKRTTEERVRIKGSSKIEVFVSTLKQIDADERLTDAERAEKRYNHITSSNGLRSLSIPEIAKLDAKILTDAAIATELTPAMLMEIQDKQKLSAKDIETVAKHIRSTSSASAHDYITRGAGAAYWA